VGLKEKVLIENSNIGMKGVGDSRKRGLGRCLIVELYGCEEGVLDSLSGIEEAMVDAADVAGANIIKTVFHKFSPYGVSGIVVIAESHLAIHTWPEHGYAAVDIFTCGETVDPWKAYDRLVSALKPRNTNVIEISRGILTPDIREVKAEDG
jgi:S-adenosylmethionine decarboxylase proenzyme